MRQTRLALAFGFVMSVAALGCSLDSPKYTGPAGILARCGVPACYLDLFMSCMPEGTCVEQDTATCGASACPTPPISSPTAETISECYSNGVKMLAEIDLSNPPAMTMTMTVKKGSTVCLSETATYSNGGTSYTVRNGAGTTVATVVGDTTARTSTITCTGGSPVVVSWNCSSPDGGTSSGSSSSCTQGTCVF